MDDIFSFDMGSEKSYFLSGNHFFMLFVALILSIFFTMYYERRSKKAQTIFVGIVTGLLILLEVGRLIYKYLFLQKNGLEINFISLTRPDFFQLCFYISLPLLILAVVIMRRKDYVFGLSFIFAMGALSGIITLIYPINVNIYGDFYNIYNLIYLLERTGLITLGFILAISRFIAARDFLDLWGGVLSIVTFGAVALALSLILGWGRNLFYMQSCPIFEEAGVFIPFPLHLLVLGAFLFLCQIVLYAPFRIYENWRNKAIQEGRYHSKY